MSKALAWNPDSSRQLSLDEHHKLATRANSLGEYLIACDIADEGLKKWTGDRRLTQLRALALARMGSNREAREILAALQSEAEGDEETLGILARTYKDLWLKSREPKDLEQAYQAYANAYRNAPERYWTGINAATLAFAKGDRVTSDRIANAVREFCSAKLESAAEGEHRWLISTVA